MNRIPSLAALVVSLFSVNSHFSTAFGQGTAFTYQGQLVSSGVPASGVYDFTFNLYSVSNGGSPIATPVTNDAVAVSNGLFTVTMDFGNAFPAANRWLEIAVGTNGTSFTTLAPRQALTPTPYAIMAEGAATASSAGTVAAADITGTISNSSLPASPVFGGTVTAGEFAGNGANLTNLPYASLNNGGTLSLVTNGLSFSFFSYLNVGEQPQFLAAVTNLNSAGHVDLAVANASGNTVSILTNNGSGGFTLTTNCAVGAAQAWIAVMDVNNDGKPDLVVANSATTNLTILTNTGTGGFASNATVAVGSEPACVTAFDVNNDGKLDLISANSGSNTLTVSTNNGHGGFAFYSTITVGPAPNCLAAADINGDSKIDLIAANSGTNTLTALLNNGNGTFLPTTVVACAASTQPVYVVAADFNGDGFMDLATANNDGTLSILTNNGNGTFTLAGTIGNLGATALAVTDYNQDGKPDLAVAATNNMLFVLLNTGKGTFAVSQTIVPPYVEATTLYSSVLAVDLNGDGLPDLMASAGDYYYAPFQELFAEDNLVEMINDGPQVSTELLLPGQSGGLRLTPGFYNDANLVGGASGNSIDTTADGSVIAGGGTGNFQGQASYNRISADYADIGGGSGNSIQLLADHSVISGGWNNTIGTGANESSIAGGEGNNNDAGFSFIGSGQGNTIQPGGDHSVIGGGSGNTIHPSGNYSFLGCGTGNSILTGAYYSFLGGGAGNSIQASANTTMLGGGYQNTIESNAVAAVLAGGQFNGILTNADHSFIGGGQYNTNTASFAMIPGGQNNIAALNCFAAGYNAQATNTGAFVWSDGNGTATGSTNANSVTFRASGGYRLFTSTGASGAFLAPNQTSWSAISDRNAKKNFKPVNCEAVLDKLAAVPVEQWNYKWEQDNDTPNVGPMAQDFKAAFYPGRDDKSITTLEFDGVELAAIKGLNQKLKEKDAEIQDLKARLDRIEQLISAKAKAE